MEALGPRARVMYEVLCTDSVSYTHLDVYKRQVQMAVWQRQGTGPVILHSDRGSQFRSGDYQRYLAANGLLCSMSAVGHYGDKAACEGFLGLLKREGVYRMKYATDGYKRQPLEC